MFQYSGKRVEVITKEFDREAAAVSSLARERAVDFARRRLARGATYQSYSSGALPISTVAFRSSLPQPTTTPLIAVRIDRIIT